MKKALEKIKIARAYVEDNNKEYALLWLRECIAELQEASKAKDEEIKALKKECEYDQRNASMSQKESAMLLDKIGAVIKLCEEKITDWRVVESGQEKAYQVILSMLKDN